MHERTLREVHTNMVGGTECWELVFDKEDGTQHAHLFPKMAIQRRIAEYGLDPADTVTALDMILHEPHIPEPHTWPPKGPPDPALALGLTVPATRQATGRITPGTPAPANVGVHLYTAPTIAAARAAHLARVEWARAHRVTIDLTQAPDEVAKIHHGHGVTAAGVAAATAEVERDRALVIHGVSGIKAPALTGLRGSEEGVE